MSKVFGGQTFKPSLFPPVKYIESLTKAYYPDLVFDHVKWRKAFEGARYPEFDAAFAAVTEDGASCNMQLCWCLLEIPPGTVLPLHAHKNLEVSYTLRGTMRERTIPGAFLPVDSLAPQEIDYLGDADTQMVDRAFATGSMVLYAPGSLHQVYTDKTEGCVLLILYSKDCTFIRATAPSVARQLLAVTADKGTSFAAPVVRKPSSFVNMGPRYARYRASMGAKATTVTCAQVAVKALADCGVRDVILYPGAKCIELLKVVDNNHYGIRGWLCRNEHAGAFIAEGYNKSQSERLCCVMTTSGPGATNLCTGIASCWRDGIPMVVITSQVPTYKKGTGAFQETPTAELYRPITKASFEITSTAEVYDTVIAACRIAVDGVNGPVVIDIPEDLQAEMVTLPEAPSTSGTQITQPAPSMPLGSCVLSTCTSGRITMPLHSPFTGVLAPSHVGLRSHVACPVRQTVLKEVLGYVKAAQQPLLLLGGGCVKCDEGMLNELVDMLGMPVVYTFMGKGCISDDHDLCLGPIGVHGLYTANIAIQRCDLLLALGCRFDERAACKSFDMWEKPVTTIHVDIVKQTMMGGSSKGHPVTLNVVADVEDFLGALLQHLYGFVDEHKPPTVSSLEEELKSFVVDEEDVKVLKESTKGAAEPGTANDTGVLVCGSPSSDNGFTCSGVACKGPSAITSPSAAAAASYPTEYPGFGSDGDWRGYSDWSKEMTELKQRRWRSLMPCLSPKSELTTREMVHLLDSFLNNKGIEAIVCSDVGSHQCLLAQYLRLHHPRQWLMEGGLASMGCGLPAAIGAAMANPQATCLAVAGDGGFAMTSQELIMSKVYKLNVKVIVTVNNRLQLVEQLEEETYDSLDVYTFLGDPDHPHRPYPNFAMLAQAYGVPSVTAWNQQELLDGLALMFANPGPFLMEVVALAERPHIKYWDSTEQ